MFQFRERGKMRRQQQKQLKEAAKEPVPVPEEPQKVKFITNRMIEIFYIISCACFSNRDRFGIYFTRSLKFLGLPLEILNRKFHTKIWGKSGTL